MVIKRLAASLTFVIVSSLTMSSLHAAEVSSSVLLTSNYIFRGQTQTKNSSAIQASYDLEQHENEGWYTGAFASTLSKGVELDFYLGWRDAFKKASKMGYDIGVIQYIYSDNSFSSDITEVYAGVNYETAYVKLFNGSGAGIKSYRYLDLGASFIVLEDLTLDLHYGHYLDSPNTSDISANLGIEVKDFDVNFGMSYEDSGAKDDVVFLVTVGKSFK